MRFYKKSYLLSPKARGLIKKKYPLKPSLSKRRNTHNLFKLYNQLSSFLIINGRGIKTMCLLNYNVMSNLALPLSPLGGFFKIKTKAEDALGFNSAFLFLTKLGVTPQSKTPNRVLSPLAFFILKLKTDVSASFLIKYKQINRKLRKIVKNKYKYVRTYEFVRPSRRWFWGLRLLRLSLAFDLSKTFKQRLSNFFDTFALSFKNTTFWSLKRHHHLTTLEMLKKK